MTDDRQARSEGTPVTSLQETRVAESGRSLSSAKQFQSLLHVLKSLKNPENPIAGDPARGGV